METEFTARQIPDMAGMDVRWFRLTASCIACMCMCAACGVTKFGWNKPLPSLDACVFQQPPPYYAEHPSLRKCCSVSDAGTGQPTAYNMCRKCMSTDWSSEVAYAHTGCNDDWCKWLTSLTPFEIQVLSVMDVNLDFEGQLRTFATAKLFQRGIMHAPLLLTNSSLMGPRIPSPKLATVLQHLLQHNSTVQQYRTIWEQHDRTIPNPYMSEHAIEHIVKHHVARDPTRLDQDSRTRPAVRCVVDSNPRPTKQAKLSTLFAPLCCRGGDVQERYLVQDNGNMLGSSCVCSTVEACVFPYLFPLGRGMWDGTSCLMAYLKHTLQKCLSLYTLVPTYLPIMYQLFHAVQLHKHTTNNVLEKEYAALKRKRPDAADTDIVRDLIKHQALKPIPGTPAYFRNQRKTLEHMCSVHGMPHLFVTLTAADTPSFKWREYEELLAMMPDLVEDPDISQVPVECARLFHERLQLLMQQCIAPSDGTGMFGRVVEWTIRYETQMRGTLHAHILLWVHADDVEGACNSIRADVPGHYHPATNGFTPFSDSEYDQRLLYLVKRLQMHRCTPDGCQHNQRGHRCQYGFPFPTQAELQPCYEQECHRWTYYRPRHCDRNVVPYHPVLLLLWGAHCNVQKISREGWSQYLLKYATKQEPRGILNLNIDRARILGLQHLSPAQLRAFTALHQSQPVAPCEAALHVLNIPIVSFSTSFTSINTAPLSSRLRTTHYASNSTLTPHVMQYSMRPNVRSLDDVTLFHYFTWYTAWPASKKVSDQSKLYRWVGEDGCARQVYRCTKPRQVMFSDFHPVTQVEAFFYTFLLQHVPFRGSEYHLLTGNNKTGSYVYECFQRGICNMDSLLDIATRWHAKHMLVNETVALLHVQLVEIVQQVMQNNLAALADMQASDGALHVCTTVEDSVLGHEVSAAARENLLPACTTFTPVGTYADLNTEQRTVFTHISQQAGLHVVSGPPGSGKTFLVRILGHHLESTLDANIVYAATTGVAALRLHPSARTAHSAFKLPASKRDWLRDLHPASPQYQSILHGSVFVVDEYSMATASLFRLFINQLMRVKQICSMDGLLHRVRIILVGDHAQIPPVCHCRREHGTLCRRCHIHYSPLWQYATVHHLGVSMRHATDLVFSRFLMRIRSEMALQTYIDSVLSECYVPNREAVIERGVTHDTTVLCTHNEDVIWYNQEILTALFAEHEILQLHPKWSCTCMRDNVPEHIQQWLLQPHWHLIPSIAIGARVIVLDNIKQDTGVVNGATGIVVDLKCRSSDIYAVVVQLDHSGQNYAVHRSTQDQLLYDAVSYTKSTFPLQLAYAYTGHKAQGATFAGPTTVHVREGFELGLVYVMLSRVTCRDVLTIVGNIRAEDCRPVPMT